MTQSYIKLILPFAAAAAACMSHLFVLLTVCWMLVVAVFATHERICSKMSILVLACYIPII